MFLAVFGPIFEQQDSFQSRDEFLFVGVVIHAVYKREGWINFLRADSDPRKVEAELQADSPTSTAFFLSTPVPSDKPEQKRHGDTMLKAYRLIWLIETANQETAA